MNLSGQYSQGKKLTVLSKTWGRLGLYFCSNFLVHLFIYFSIFLLLSLSFAIFSCSSFPPLLLFCFSPFLAYALSPFTSFPALPVSPCKIVDSSFICILINILYFFMQAIIRTCQEFKRSLFCGIFTESAPGLIQSSSRNVRLCVRPNMPSCCLQQNG